MTQTLALVNGEIIRGDDGRLTLVLNTTVPCLDHPGEQHLLEAEHVLPSNMPLHLAIGLPHLYEMVGGLATLHETIDGLADTAKRKIKTERLEDVVEDFDDIAYLALATLDANGFTLASDDDDDDIDLSGLLAAIFGQGGPLDRSESFIPTTEEAEAMGLKRPTAEEIREMARRLARGEPRDAGVASTPPKAGEVRFTVQTPDVESFRRSTGRVKGGQTAPERTVVVSVTKKQAEDYADRNVFADIAATQFPGKAVAVDLRLPVSVAEAMFTDAQTQGSVGSGPRRRMYQTAGDRLRAALNADEVV